MDNRLAVSYRMVLLSQGVRGLLALIVFITSSGLANALCLQDPDASVSNAKAAYQHAQTAVVNATSRLDAARTTGLTGNDARKSAEAETARREMNGEQERLRARRQQLTVEEQDSRAEKEIGKLESASLDLKASKNKLREDLLPPPHISLRGHRPFETKFRIVLVLRILQFYQACWDFSVRISNAESGPGEQLVPRSHTPTSIQLRTGRFQSAKVPL